MIRRSSSIFFTSSPIAAKCWLMKTQEHITWLSRDSPNSRALTGDGMPDSIELFRALRFFKLEVWTLCLLDKQGRWDKR